MTNLFSNGSMSRILSSTLVNTRDLAHCVAWALSPCIWKQKYHFPGGGSFYWNIQVSPKWFRCWYCSYKLLSTWLIDTVIIFLGVSNHWASSPIANFAIDFWSFFEFFVDSFSMVSVGFLSAAAVVVENVLLNWIMS